MSIKQKTSHRFDRDDSCRHQSTAERMEKILESLKNVRLQNMQIVAINFFLFLSVKSAFTFKLQ